MKKLLVSVLAATLVLSACGGPKDEKQAYIDATIEATCMIFESEDIFDPALEEEAKEIYAKYGFSTDDEAAMEAVTAKYAEDTEVQTAISTGIEECSAAFVDSMDIEGEDTLEEDMDLETEDTDMEGDDETLDVEVDADAEVTTE